MIEINGYRISGKINQKEEFQIYRAIRLTDSLPVILKYARDTIDSNRLIKEYEILQYLNDSSIIKSYDLIPYLNGSVLVLEDGGDSLKNYLLQKKALSLEEFLSIALELSNILSIVHKHKIIHKDIKPANFVVRKDESGKSIIKLIDFGISTRLKREEMGWKSLEVLEGSLPYISPEQTGRVNRAIDYRTDFYSLGITFYELLTGRLPFIYKDPVELIHSHIAKNPPDILELGKDVPENLSLIIKKLMSKNPEDRYNSASGLRYDLENIDSSGFVLGKKDYSDVFNIPQKLYGREKEIETLLSLFNSLDKSQMLLVSGYSGIGKTSFVNETHKSITEKNGYFIKGKFDQFQRNIPFYAIVQAFRELMNQILTESEEKLKKWKGSIQSALGENGQVIVDVIPELVHIIGKQNPVTELGPTENQNRFNLTFLHFISVFTKKNHPVVLFIDDLQWADTPSLNLIKLLMTEADSKYLMIIGAFRDNEVDSTHPLTNTIDELKKSGIEIGTIHLGPLETAHILELLSDTLHTKENILSLSSLLAVKTGGNPFFLTEYLKSLYKEVMINFDYDSNCWKWNEEKIQSYKITDNVVDLMVSNLKKLSGEAIHIISLASCLGNKFNVELLSVISGLKIGSVIKLLVHAMEEGFLISEDVSIRFQHDRVQQAAYTFISEDKKKETHLQIGRLLLENTKEEELEDKLFDIVNQYNRGVELIEVEQEKLKLIRLNLKAGRKAKNGTAYAPALEFIKKAKDLLPENSWNHYYELTLEIYYELAELEYLNVHFIEAEACFQEVYNNIKTLPDKLPIIHIQLRQKVTEGKADEAFRIGFSVLNELGIKLPDPSSSAEIDSVFSEYLNKFNSIIKKKSIAKFYYLPEMENPMIKEAISLITNLGDIAIVFKPNFLGLMALLGVMLSIEHGNTKESSISYVMWGVVVNIAFQQYEEGYELGTLGLRLAKEKFANDLIYAKSMAFYGWNIQHWVKHCKHDIELAKEACELSLKNSDIVYAGYFVIMLSVVSFFISLSLSEVIEYSRKSILFGEKNKYAFVKDMTVPVLQMSLALSGQLNSRTSFNDENFDEDTFVEDSHGFGQGLAYFYMYKVQLYFLYGEYKTCFDLLPGLEKSFAAIPRHIIFCEFHFYIALTIIANFPLLDREQKEVNWKKYEESYKLLKLWSGLCRENFEHKLFLLEAETARMKKNKTRAMRRYEDAINSAKKYGYINDAALASELYANFWFEQKQFKIGILYTQEAYLFYGKWGALAKCKQLEEKYPDLLKGSHHGISATKTDTTHSSHYTNTDSIDVQTIIKSYTAIAEEIRMDVLLEKIMKIIIENAGAERGALLLLRDDRFYIEAFLKDGINVLKESIALEDSNQIPKTVLKFVERTHNSLILQNAVEDNRFNSDACIRENRIRSILSSPILNKGELKGIIYLENNLSSDVFTDNRVQVVNMLSGQAAISLENARLYQISREKENQYRTLIENINIGVYRNTGGARGEFLQVNPAMAKIFGYEIVEDFLKIHVAELYENMEERTKFIEIMQKEGICKNLELRLKKKDGSWFYANCSASVSYDEDGKMLWMDGIIEDITERKNAELQRQKFTEELTELNASLEERVVIRTAELSAATKQAEIEKSLALLAQEDAEKEREKSDKLLLNILPKKIADELKEKGHTEPVLFENVSVMFTDFKGFTQIAEKLSPQELVKDLDGCFSQFDNITERYGLEKLKTIGDSYMCAGGIPKVTPAVKSAVDCVLAALEIQSFMNQMKDLKQMMGFPYWELRLGIHSGPLVAGVIGEKKFAYDVWGDTVNTASRMESSGTPGKINISGITYNLVKALFDCEFRGQVNAKNKGPVDMYYVNGLKPEYSKDEERKIPNEKFWELYGILSS